MGLDNGIWAHREGGFSEKTMKAIAIYEYREEAEVAYWRKCWQVRRAIFEALGEPDENDSIIKMDRDDVVRVINALKKFNKKTWYDDGPPFWEWDEYKWNHKRNIKRLKRLARLMKKYPDVIVEFYDSY